MLMITQTEAIIFLADHRTCSQSHWYRSYQAIKTGQEIPGNLILLNDDVLKAGCTYQYAFKEDALFMILPMAGGLNYSYRHEENFIEAGECRMLSVQKDEVVSIANVYETELINYICAAWKMKVPLHDVSSHRFEFQGNELQTLHPLVSIGKFDGRTDRCYSLRNSEKGVLAVVLEGAFEVQNRLLQTRDSLMLWNCSEIEFEALSENAILLLLETELPITSP